MSDTIYYSTRPDEERLLHETAEDAVEALLDDMSEDALAALPDTVPVYGWVRTSIKGHLTPEETVDDMLEYLDEEYGDPDGNMTNERTPAMVEAAKAFIAAIEADYIPWTCERGPVETFDIREMRARMLRSNPPGKPDGSDGKE